MENKYGHFNENGSEFIITNPDIPRNWYNYFYNDNFISFTSQAGRGEAFLQDNMGRRIYPVKERGVYVFDGEKGWNLTGTPFYEKYQHYECSHGLGYTKITLIKNETETEFLSFVPCENDEFTGYEISFIKVKNLSKKTKKYKVMSFCGNNLDGEYQYQGYNTATAEFDNKVNGIHYGFSNEWNGKNTDFEFFIVSGQPLSGYDCARNAFIGSYGSVDDPVAIHKGGCSDSNCIAEKFGFAVQSDIELKSGEEKSVCFASGVTSSIEKVNQITNIISTEQSVENLLNEVKEKYSALCENAVIKTPDKNLDKLLNNWLKYQTDMGSRWARVRHNGYRDMLSDTECLAAFEPKKAFLRLKRIMSYQYSNGYAPRTFIDGEIRDNGFSDCAVWLTFTAYTIINELGDVSLLNEEVKFNDGTKATVYEHLRRSVDFLYHFRGNHNLIRIWRGDWNDCMDRAGIENKGVSVWLTIAWYRANKQFGSLAKAMGREDDYRISIERGEEIRDLVDKFGWDEKGGYYIYAISDDFHKIGSSDSEQGRIFLNPQLWAVLSGISLNGKEIQAMENVEKLLDDELGTSVSEPYTKYFDYIGSMTAKSPGVQENGGVYLHSMAWKLAVDAILQRNDLVERDMNRILPFNNPVVDGRAEPYILCNCYMSKSAGYRYGTPGQSWRTASGQWFLKAMLQFVFGLNPTLQGLEINPCLPKSWKNAAVKRNFRDCIYNIEYKKTGSSSITADGKAVSGKILPYKKGAKISVKVTY